MAPDVRWVCGVVMGNRVMAEVGVVGVRPLLWHAFGAEEMGLERPLRHGVAGNDPTEWERSLLVTQGNQLYVEPSYIFGCLRDGAAYVGNGRASLQGLVAATLQVVDEIVLVNRYLPKVRPLPRDKDLPVYLDVRGVRNPATRGRNVRHRVAASKGWKMTFRLTWDRSVVSVPEMKSVVLNAGQLAGIGDARSIGYGRFAPVDEDVFKMLELH